jgi:hypothetical protein
MSIKSKYEDIAKNINTGDLILFAGRDIDSKIIRRFIKTKWCHIGVAIKIPDWDIILLWEYSPTATLSDSLHGHKRRGVQIVPLERRLGEYSGEFSIRHLKDVDIEDEPLLKKTFVRYKKEVQHRYREHGIINGWKFRIEFAIDAIKSIFMKKSTNKKAINCAHMVAELYQQMGLLERFPKGKNSWEFTPRDFVDEANISLKRGYLSNQIDIEV